MARDPRVAIVVSEGAPSGAQHLANVFAARTKRLGLPFDRFKARPAQVAGRPWDKPTRLLSGNEAHELYQLLHRYAVLVASFGQVYIARNPMHRLVARRHATTLEAFVRYKASFHLIRRAHDVDGALRAFAAWRAQVGCDGESDPRALPFHVFDGGRDWTNLDERAGAEAFSHRFGRSRRLVDASARSWNRAVRAAYHGHDELHVALCELPRGMHWEVAVPGGGELSNAREVWRYRSPDDYLNAYADGHIRGGGGRSRAHKIWPK